MNKDRRWVNNNDPGILRKKNDEHKDLFVFGYGCKIFRDDQRALEMDQGKHLISWMDDETLKIDRYDARGHLSDLTPYEGPSEEYVPTLEERRIESLCDEERYRSLSVNEEESLLYQEEELKRLKQLLNTDKTYGQVAYQYMDSAQMNSKDKAKDMDVVEDDELFTANPLLDLPPNMCLPRTVKENQIIEKTAMHVALHGPQVEILIKTKQANNPKLHFLHVSSPIHPYYQLILSHFKAGRYRPTYLEASTSSEMNQDHYLHPSLASTVEAAPSIPSIPYKPSSDCAYNALVKNIRTVQEAAAELPREEPKEPERSEIPKCDSSNWSPMRIEKGHNQVHKAAADLPKEEPKALERSRNSVVDPNIWPPINMEQQYIQGPVQEAAVELPREEIKEPERIKTPEYEYDTSCWGSPLRRKTENPQDIQSVPRIQQQSTITKITTTSNKNNKNRKVAQKPPESNEEIKEPERIKTPEYEYDTSCWGSPLRRKTENPQDIQSVPRIQQQSTITKITTTSNKNNENRKVAQKPPESNEPKKPSRRTQYLISGMVEFALKTKQDPAEMLRELVDSHTNFTQPGHVFYEYYRQQLDKIRSRLDADPENGTTSGLPEGIEYDPETPTCDEDFEFSPGECTEGSSTKAKAPVHWFGGNLPRKMIPQTVISRERNKIPPPPPALPLHPVKLFYSNGAVTPSPTASEETLPSLPPATPDVVLNSDGAARLNKLAPVSFSIKKPKEDRLEHTSIFPLEESSSEEEGEESKGPQSKSEPEKLNHKVAAIVKEVPPQVSEGDSIAINKNKLNAIAKNKGHKSKSQSSLQTTTTESSQQTQGKLDSKDQRIQKDPKDKSKREKRPRKDDYDYKEEKRSDIACASIALSESPTRETLSPFFNEIEETKEFDPNEEKKKEERRRKLKEMMQKMNRTLELSTELQLLDSHAQKVSENSAHLAPTSMSAIVKKPEQSLKPLPQHGLSMSTSLDNDDSKEMKIKSREKTLYYLNRLSKHISAIKKYDRPTKLNHPVTDINNDGFTEKIQSSPVTCDPSLLPGTVTSGNLEKNDLESKMREKVKQSLSNKAAEHLSDDGSKKKVRPPPGFAPLPECVRASYKKKLQEGLLSGGSIKQIRTRPGIASLPKHGEASSKQSEQEDLLSGGCKKKLQTPPGFAPLPEHVDTSSKKLEKKGLFSDEYKKEINLRIAMFLKDLEASTNNLSDLSSIKEYLSSGGSIKKTQTRLGSDSLSKHGEASSKQSEQEDLLSGGCKKKLQTPPGFAPLPEHVDAPSKKLGYKCFSSGKDLLLNPDLGSMEVPTISSCAKQDLARENDRLIRDMIRERKVMSINTTLQTRREMIKRGCIPYKNPPPFDEEKHEANIKSSQIEGQESHPISEPEEPATVKNSESEVITSDDEDDNNSKKGKKKHKKHSHEHKHSRKSKKHKSGKKSKH